MYRIVPERLLYTMCLRTFLIRPEDSLRVRDCFAYNRALNLESKEEHM